MILPPTFNSQEDLNSFGPKLSQIKEQYLQCISQFMDRSV